MAGRHAVSVPPLAFKRREDRHTTVVGGAAGLAARTRMAAAAATFGGQGALRVPRARDLMAGQHAARTAHVWRQAAACTRCLTGFAVDLETR